MAQQLLTPGDSREESAVRCKEGLPPTCRVSRSKAYTFLLLLMGRTAAPGPRRVPGASTSAATSTVCRAVISSQAKGREAPGARLSHTQLAGASWVVLQAQQIGEE